MSSPSQSFVLPGKSFSCHFLMNMVEFGPFTFYGSAGIFPDGRGSSSPRILLDSLKTYRTGNYG